MPQQAPPEVGTVIDGYRFKGGDPKVEASWEQTEPLPAPEYGQGAMRLPNGAVVRYGPRGGMDTIVSASQAAAAGNGTESAPLVGADARARFMINLGPLQAAQENLERMEADGYDPGRGRNLAGAALEGIPFDGGYAARLAGGEDYNAYNQAAKTFEAAILPIMSGSAVTPSEAQRQIRATIAQPGDSAEVRAQKAAQRRMMINAVAQGIGQPVPYDSTTPGLDAQGLPDYQGFVGREASDVPPVDGAPPAGPGSSAENPLDFTTASRDDVVAAIQRGGWFRQGPDGQPYELPAGTPEFGAQPGDEMVGPGVGVRRSSEDIRESATNQRSRPGLSGQIGATDRGVARRADAFVRGIANGATFGFDDNIVAGLDTLLPLDPGSRAFWQDDLGFGGAYRHNLATQRGYDDADEQDLPLTRGAGQITGAVAGGYGATRVVPQVLRQAPRVVGATRTADNIRRAANVARVSAGGALGGATYGAGESETFEGAPGNALEGGIAGGVLAPVAQAVARPVIGGVQSGLDAARRAFRPNALEGAANTYANRFRPDTNVLSSRADELEGLGIEPAFIDVVDDARLGTFRAINTRDTLAREPGTRLAETRRGNLPSRVRQIADAEISGETRPTLEVMDELSATRRANAQEGMADFGGQQVRLNENAVQAVRSDMARNAIRDAAARAQASLDPAERAAAGRLSQLADMALDNPAGAAMTVREAQDVSAALNAAADGAYRSTTPANGPVLKDLARAIRASARESSDGYDNWLRQYADDSQLLEASTTGRNFVQASRDPINERGTDAFVRQATNATPPELAVQRAAARQAMEAQGADPTGARSVLESFSSNQDQARRAAAIGADPARLQARSAAELRMVQNAQNVSPRIGAQTGTNMADQAAEIGGTARDVMTGNLPGLGARLGRRLMSRGFSDREAEAIGQAALDPARTREIIDLLATRMNRAEARSTLRAIRFSAAQGAGNMAGDEE